MWDAGFICGFLRAGFPLRCVSSKGEAMTSLAEQLKRLALPQSDPSLLNRSEAASLLFDCKEAAAIDRDTFFAIGKFGSSRVRDSKNHLKKQLEKIK